MILNSSVLICISFTNCIKLDHSCSKLHCMSDQSMAGSQSVMDILLAWSLNEAKAAVSMDTTKFHF